MTTPAAVSAGAPVITSTTRLWRGVVADRWGRFSLAIVAAFALVALGSTLGWWADDWAQAQAAPWQPPSSEHWFGTNRLGQDVAARAAASTATAFAVGVPVALASTLLGALLGGLAGWFHGRAADELVLWIMGVLDSIPFFLFVAAVAYALQGHPWAMHVAMIATFWTTAGRLVRAEVMRLRERTFVDAARLIGLGDGRILLRHVLPNAGHILLVQSAIAFVAAIKSEVILSFLGLGIQDGVSWGLMLAESTDEVLAGQFANFVVASACLFALLMGVNGLTDALQDATDPRRADAREDS